MLIFRFGGDVWIKIVDASGNVKYDFLLEMKRNSKENWNRIEKSFQEVKENIKERPIKHR